MMTGRVIDGRPCIDVEFVLPDQRSFEIEFVVDTGFNGFLTLSAEAVELLKLPQEGIMEAHLADGTVQRVRRYTTTVLWEGSPRSVSVLALGNRPLMGAALLAFMELTIQFAEGGAVTLNPL